MKIKQHFSIWNTCDHHWGLCRVGVETTTCLPQPNIVEKNQFMVQATLFTQDFLKSQDKLWFSFFCLLPSLTNPLSLSVCLFAEISTACKRKEQDHGRSERGNVTKKPRLVFTDVQRRTLHAIFKENKRPSKELQLTIAQQLGLELATVSNFFMNARRRSLDKWVDDGSGHSANSGPNACTKAWRRTDLTNSWTDSTSVEKL